MPHYICNPKDVYYPHAYQWCAWCGTSLFGTSYMYCNETCMNEYCAWHEKDKTWIPEGYKWEQELGAWLVLQPDGTYLHEDIVKNLGEK